MNTSSVIARYTRADGVVEITSAQLLHELLEANRKGRKAALRDVDALIEKRHPANERGNKMGVYTA